MRQKLYRGRRSVFYKRSRAPHIIGGILAAVAVVAVGFFGAKWINEHPVIAPDDSSAPTVSAPDTSTPVDAPVEETPTAPDTDVVRGFYLPFDALTGDGLTATLTAAKEAGFNTVVFDMKDAKGRMYYRFSADAAVRVNSYVSNALSADQLSALLGQIRAAGLLAIPRLYAFQDDPGAKALTECRITPKDNPGWVWYDGNPQSGAKAWLNPYSNNAHAYITALATELKTAGADAVMLDGVQFPRQTTSASFGADNAGLKQDEVLALFVDKVQQTLGADCPVLMGCTTEGALALGTATLIYGGNPLTFAPDVACPAILPAQLPATIKVGETVVQNTPDALEQTVQTLVAQMVLRTKVLAEEQQPTFAPFLQVADYSAQQVKQEIAGCIAGGAESYILYNPTGQYDFAAY